MTPGAGQMGGTPGGGSQTPGGTPGGGGRSRVTSANSLHAARVKIKNGGRAKTSCHQCKNNKDPSELLFCKNVKWGPGKKKGNMVLKVECFVAVDRTLTVLVHISLHSDGVLVIEWLHSTVGRSSALSAWANMRQLNAWMSCFDCKKMEGSPSGNARRVRIRVNVQPAGGRGIPIRGPIYRNPMDSLVLHSNNSSSSNSRHRKHRINYHSNTLRPHHSSIMEWALSIR